MWATMLPDGRVKYRMKTIDPVTGKRKDFSVIYPKDTARNRNDAQSKLTIKVNMLMAQSSPSLTFGDLVNYYLDDLKLRVRESTYKRNKTTMNTLLSILGENTLIEKLTARLIINKLIKTGKSNATINEYMVRFKSMIRWAYKADLIESTKLADKMERLPDASHKQKIADKFMEAAELRTLLDSMSNERWCLLTAFLALSGLRIGEAIALNRSDVDVSSRVIHINKTYNPVNGSITPPKTESSAGDVYMQDDLLEVVKQINLFQAKEMLLKQFRSKLFLSGEDGDHIHYYAFNKYFKENTKAVLGRELTTHSLRHTHASLLFENGFTENEVGRRLRHSNSQVTKEIYIHITEKLKEQDADKLQKINLF